MTAQFESAPPRSASIDPVWRRWGPYLSERQWGTVREDYSEFGAAWDFFPHDHARSRAYRWGEDGLLGISDDGQRLCFALALWNGVDPILKERLFGLTGSQGNHGEDVKEYYYYLDATPDHAYLKGLYKYPQRPFPYEDLVAENRRRGRDAPEYELLDTGIFAEDRYFDVFVEYAKAAPDDLLIRISAVNRGPETAPLHLLPTLWFRNTWSWGRDDRRPELRAVPRHANSGTGTSARGGRLVQATHHDLGDFWLVCQGNPDLLFTENESNAQRIWGAPNRTTYVKDGIHEAVVRGHQGAINPDEIGTKVAAHYVVEIAPGATETVLLRLSNERHTAPLTDAQRLFTDRIAEADALYASLAQGKLSEDEARVQRQALAGLIWSKQFYFFDVPQWLAGDPPGPPPPPARRQGRNAAWRHLSNSDVISMPDTWEYPWYAAWDLAFHCVAFGLIDPGFAKDQLLLMLREWYMHPNGQIPAYEWAFGDVNPPVHVLAARALVGRERRQSGTFDREFLARLFHKLLLNFNWWVNRKDADGSNVFEGGFLGLDNIGVIDRSSALPAGVRLEQSDGTAWMATYCLGMGWTALELAQEDPAFEDMVTKFFEHFMAIGGALNGFGEGAATLWDEEDGFYYDALRLPDGNTLLMKVRSLVGLLPIVPALPYSRAVAERAPTFAGHARRYLDRHPELASLAIRPGQSPHGPLGLLTLVPEERLVRILARMFDPAEFLSDYGIRAISRYHLDHPYELRVRDQVLSVKYEPAESSTGMFGGNSNWRGPIWFPMNFLLVMGLRNLHRYFGDDFLIEYPTGSGTRLPLDRIADDLSRRLVSIFLWDEEGRRPVFGGAGPMQTDPHWRDHILFYEYFHGDNGAGIGASHQTGWTALVANLLDDVAHQRATAAAPSRGGRESPELTIGGRSSPATREGAMLEAAFWGVASASSLLIGALIAVWFSLPSRLIGLVMGFGAGALISAVSFELVEEAITAARGTWIVGVGITAGALTFFGGDWLIDRRGGAERKSASGEQAEGNPAAIVLGSVLDGVPESIVVGGSLVAGGGVSVAMVAAAFLSNLPESLGATAGLAKAGMPHRRLLGMWLGIVAISGIAAAFGFWVLDDASPRLGAFFQSFAAGAMLTMLADTMMPEAFEEGGKLVGLFTVLGFALAVWLSFQG